LDKKIYVMGGEFTSSLNQVYDPGTDTWSQSTSIPTNVFAAGAAATNGVLAPKRIYLMGGVTTNGPNSSVVAANQVYDPETDSWTQGAAMPEARLFTSIAVLDDKLYVIGGMTGFPTGGAPTYNNEQFVPIGYGGETQTSPSPAVSPSVPEFPAWVILLSLIVTLGFAFVVRRKLKALNSR
jgi:N-acetylneuraminic acid mutarotase